MWQHEMFVSTLTTEHKTEEVKLNVMATLQVTHGNSTDNPSVANWEIGNGRPLLLLVRKF